MLANVMTSGSLTATNESFSQTAALLAALVTRDARDANTTLKPK